jgi:hypothetical protein
MDQPQRVSCPNPLCDKAFTSDDAVCSHLSILGSDCGEWANELVSKMLYKEAEELVDEDGVYVSFWTVTRLTHLRR